MKALSRVSKMALIVVTALCLVSGGLLIWAGQSWYALVWLTAKAAFPQTGARVVMVNTEATLKRRSDYSLPDDLVHNIALRALIVDRREKVVATAWREGHLREYPEPAAHGESSRMDMLYFRVISWMEVLRVAGWMLGCIGAVDAVAMCFIRISERKSPVLNA
ncbi:MAG: hypothetical protein HZA90_00385 [Verrucomicrobia bacterium]|nr:hypothetical protein [Verrucomicrobiota bacterium]